MYLAIIRDTMSQLLIGHKIQVTWHVVKCEVTNFGIAMYAFKSRASREYYSEVNLKQHQEYDVMARETYLYVSHSSKAFREYLVSAKVIVLPLQSMEAREGPGCNIYKHLSRNEADKIYFS